MCLFNTIIVQFFFNLPTYKQNICSALLFISFNVLMIIIINLMKQVKWYIHTNSELEEISTTAKDFFS